MEFNEPESLKLCPVCKATLPESAYYKRNTGRLSHACKTCTRAKSATYRAHNPEKAAQAVRAARLKKLEEYTRKARVLAQRRVATGKQAQASAAFVQRHPERHAATQARRRARKLLATPSWADAAAIAAIYAEARARSAATGVQHDVDHVLPLRGKYVSGLHVHNNLQIITAVENKQKGNQHDT